MGEYKHTTESKITKLETRIQQYKVSDDELTAKVQQLQQINTTQGKSRKSIFK
jgi:hypothetical protein